MAPANPDITTTYVRVPAPLAQSTSTTSLPSWKLRRKRSLGTDGRRQRDEKSQLQLEKTHRQLHFHRNRSRVPGSKCFYRSVGVLSLCAGSAHFYLLSLVGGDLEWIKQNMGKIGTLLVLSVLLYTAAITLVYTLKFPTSWRMALGITLVLELALLRNADQGMSFDRHGGYNMLIFFAIGVPLNLVVLGIVLLYRSTSYFWHILTSIMTFLLLYAGTTLLHQKAQWGEGLLGRSYQADAVACRIPEPNWPFVDLLPSGAQNFWTGRQSCPSTSTKFDAQLTQDDGLLTIDGCPQGLPTSYDVLPDTRSWSALEKQRYMMNRLIVQRTVRRNYTGPVRLDRQSAETVIARCGDEEKLLLRIGRTLPPLQRSTQQVEMQRPNVLLLYFDAVSRRHFQRRLRRTSRLIEELHQPGQRQVYQFFRSHAVGFNTDDNSRGLYTGTTNRSQIDPVWQQFRDNGYVVARTDTSCEDWSSWYQGRNTSMTALDHEMLGPACLPPYYALEGHPYGNFNGPYSLKRRCAYGDYVHSWNFDFARRFLDVYPDRPWLLSVNFIEGHEGSGEVLATVDHQLHAFVAELRDKGTLNNTVVFFYADHGLHMGLNYLFTQNGRIEHQNPVLLMMLPSYVASRLRARDGRDGLLANEQALVTPFNSHATLRVLAGLKRWPPSPSPNVDSPYWDMSLFEPQPRNLTCASVGIEEEYCRCK